MNTSSGKIIPLHQVASYSLLGNEFQFLLQGQDTNHTLALLHTYILPQSGTPPHLHQTFEEWYYLIKGTLQITIGSHSQTIAPETLVYVPRDTAHSYLNLSDHPAELLIWASPAGIEAYILELSTALSMPDSQIQGDRILSVEESIDHCIKTITAQHDFILVDEPNITS